MVQENSLKKFAIVICGPTGSGKSDLALNLAKILNTEIISADSIAIYKHLNVGSAKPTDYERSIIKHHLIDVFEPFEQVTVSDYEEKASKSINELFSKGKIPIICGGTGFYVNSLLYDFSYGNCGKNEEIRLKYEKLYQEKGAQFVYNLLKEIDPITAEKLHYNDKMRVIRALEIFECSGVKKSDIVDEAKEKFPFVAFSYNMDRALLYERINLRVEKMFNLGLVDEVKGLIQKGLTIENQSMQGIGYKEFFEFDSIDDHVEEIKENIKQNSRRYAKRQITFFKKLKYLRYIDYVSIEKSVETVLGVIKNEFNYN